MFSGAPWFPTVMHVLLLIHGRLACGRTKEDCKNLTDRVRKGEERSHSLGFAKIPVPVPLQVHDLVK